MMLKHLIRIFVALSIMISATFTYTALAAITLPQFDGGDGMRFTLSDYRHMFEDIPDDEYGLENGLIIWNEKNEEFTLIKFSGSSLYGCKFYPDIYYYIDGELVLYHDKYDFKIPNADQSPRVIQCYKKSWDYETTPIWYEVNENTVLDEFGYYKMLPDDYLVFSPPIYVDSKMQSLGGWKTFKTKEVLDEEQAQLDENGIYWDAPTDLPFTGGYILSYDRKIRKYVCIRPSISSGLKFSIKYYDNTLMNCQTYRAAFYSDDWYIYDGNLWAKQTERRVMELCYEDIIFSSYDITYSGYMCVVGGKRYKWNGKVKNNIQPFIAESTKNQIYFAKTSEQTLEQALAERIYLMCGNEFDNYWYDGNILILGRQGSLNVVDKGKYCEQPYHMVNMPYLGESIIYVVGVSGNNIYMNEINETSTPFGDLAIPWDLKQYNEGQPIYYYGPIYGQARVKPNAPEEEFVRWSELDTLLANGGDISPDIEDYYPPTPTPPPDPTPTPDATPTKSPLETTIDDMSESGSKADIAALEDMTKPVELGEDGTFMLSLITAASVIMTQGTMGVGVTIVIIAIVIVGVIKKGGS